MKRIHLDHLYGGQVLSPAFMWLAPMDATEYPIDHGYEFYYHGKCLGECRVVERRSVRIGDISDSLSFVLIGAGHVALQLDLAKRMGQIHDDTRVYVFCLQYLRVYQPYFKALTEHSERMLAKSNPLSYQSKF